MVKIVAQTGVKVAKQQDSQKTKSAKPSKFEQKRAEFEKRQVDSAAIPPEVTQISPEQKRILETTLRKRIEQGTAQDALKVDLRAAQVKLDALSQKVAAAPKSPAIDAVRKRLDSVEAQVQDADKLMKSLTGMESPRQMLNIQMQLYRMTQNVELMTKFVEQGASGIKTIMQTQV